jgi:hypothetical protein
VGEFLGSWATEVGDDYVVSRLGKEEEKKNKKEKGNVRSWLAFGCSTAWSARACDVWLGDPAGPFLFHFFLFPVLFPSFKPTNKLS